MMTLRCTRRLLDYFNAQVNQGDRPVGPPPLLGDWYANLLRHYRRSFALCVNEKTRLAVLVPVQARDDILQLYIRLAQRLFDIMCRIGIEENVTAHVLDEHRGGVWIAPTNNRSVLGTMNDLAQMTEYYLDSEPPGATLTDISGLEDLLNRTPHRPLEWANATERLIALCRRRV